MAPDEGNMYLLAKMGSEEQKAHFLEPLVAGRARSAFFMSEPADEGGAGSDPSMMKTRCRRDGVAWIIDGRSAERRVGTECGRTCSIRWLAAHSKKKKNITTV